MEIKADLRVLPLERAQSDAMIADPGQGLDRLREVMRRLRDPATGCPWDIEQDFASIAPYTIEEAYEVADAIERDAMQELPGELGDLLLQVAYHTQMAEEAGLFGMDQVIGSIVTKMVARHPHVFADESRDKTAEQQTRDWEKAKAGERAAGVLDGVALGLPALSRAVKLQNRAARVGFDWPQTDMVLDKLAEESRELVEARDSTDLARMHDEMGDMLFVMANLARHLGLDPEAALRSTNEKFTRRIKRIEEILQQRSLRFDQCDLAELDAIWNQAKAEEKART